MSHRRLYELDALRGIAALSVALFHYTTRFGRIYGTPVDLPFQVSLGHYGVQLFFIISGFVIFLTLSKTNSGYDFIVSRFSRLYPPYWAAVIFTFSMVALFSLPGREVSLFQAVLNLTMVQYWLQIPAVDGVYWSLAFELAFYFWMLTVFVLKLNSKITILSMCWLCLICLISILEKTETFELPVIIKTSLVVDYGNLFTAGIMFYQLMFNSRSITHHAIIIACLLVQFLIHNFEGGIVCFFFFVMFYLFVYGKLGFISKKPLIFLGTISYSFYLLHQNIGYIIIRALHNWGLMEWYFLIIPIAATMMLATIFNVVIEKPCQRWIRGRWRNSHLKNRLIHGYH